MATILIIEDDEANYVLIKSLVEALGHDSLHAYEAQDGLILARQRHPDLIILDMRLPGINGWEFAKMVKSDAQLDDTPIIAVSVRANTSDERRAMEAGCDVYIAKPFKVGDLRQVINNYLG